MAITRAQQFKQMLQDGGRIGFFTGMREQEQREQAANLREQTSVARTQGKSAPTAQEVRDIVNRGPDDRGSDTQNLTQQLVKEGKTPREIKKITKTEKPNPLLNLLDPRRRIYNLTPNDPGTELRFLSRLTPAQAATLPASLKARYDMIQNTDFSGDLSFKDALGEDYKKFTFEEFEDLKNYGDNDFAKYAGKQEGKFGLLLGGDVGNIDVFRKPDGTYDYRVKSGRDEDPLFLSQGIPPDEEENQPGDGSPADDDLSRFFRLMADGGSVDDMEREAMFLGGITKGLKKAVRGVKKLVKSPIGKAAIGAALFRGVGGLEGLKSFFGAGSFSPFKAELTNVLGPDAGFGPSGLGRLLGDKFVNQVTGNLTGLGKFTALGVPAALAGIMTDKQKDEFKMPDYPDFNMQAYLQNPYKYTTTRQMADGGIMREGYQKGSKEPVATKTMPLLDMDGKEMDFRQDGGFVPIGRMEKADDVPARLSKNEFVFTADAVRNAGDGDVDKGAEVMYNMMKNLEAGGEVSEESQGLEGARKMFQTSKRLEEVL